MNYHFIAIEGNIGAGKTTLAHMLARHFNARLILEQFADNPFLPKFYENPAQNAFPLELFFMAERYKQLKELVYSADLFQSVTVTADYLSPNASCLPRSISPNRSSACIRISSTSSSPRSCNPISSSTSMRR